MTLQQLINSTRSRLEPLYGRDEAEWMIRITMEHLKGWDRTELILRADREVSDFIADKVAAVTDRLVAGEPLQYILGDTYWHGMTLKVTPDVLIPRPETSQLVDIICDENKGDDLRVLDVCTGSGCIAIALASTLPFSAVTAVDISDKALAVARENAALRKVRVDYLKADALKPLPLREGSFDIVVSNPPYIAESEKKEMDKNVVDYEPALALFVPDDDPLRFYTPIALTAYRLLKPGGKLYFEVNSDYATDVACMLSGHGWDDAQVLIDLYGRKRFVTAHK